MKRGAGKSKGSAFERWVGAQLSLWLTGGTDKTQLIRSALSGGWAAGRSGDAPWRHVGDLAPNGPLGDLFRQQFGVECKFHKTLDLWGLWRADGGQLIGWWDKIAKECAPTGLTPLLICKGNHLPVMVLTTLLTRTRRRPEGWLLPALDRVVEISWHGLMLFPFAELLAGDPARLLQTVVAGTQANTKEG